MIMTIMSCDNNDHDNSDYDDDDDSRGNVDNDFMQQITSQKSHLNISNQRNRMQELETMQHGKLETKQSLYQKA